MTRCRWMVPSTLIQDLASDGCPASAASRALARATDAASIPCTSTMSCASASPSASLTWRSLFISEHSPERDEAEKSQDDQRGYDDGRYEPNLHGACPPMWFFGDARSASRVSRVAVRSRANTVALAICFGLSCDAI